MGGPVEEAGKVASGIVDALKAQPAVLALTIAVIGMLVFIFYALHVAAEFRDTMLKQQNEYQREVTQLLARCVVPQRTSVESKVGEWTGAPPPLLPPMLPPP
jgi:hypothetical protein